MKNSLLIIGLILLVGLKVGFHQNHAEKEEIHEDYQGLKQYWNQRVGTYSSAEDFVSVLKKVRKQIASVPKKRSLGLDWKELGPDNIGGRVRALLIDNQNPNLMFAGGVSGGLWYSSDAGLTWSLTAPGDDAENLSVNCITQDELGYIYYGTGEGIFLSLASGSFPTAMSSAFRGKGVFRSTEPHGTTFQLMTDSWDGKEEYMFAVSSITNDGKGNIYAGGKNRLYRSQDRGETWQAVNGTISSSVITGDVFDVKALSDGTVFLAMGGSYYKSSTGDVYSFEKISGVSEVLTPASGRSVFAVAPSDENIIYISRSNSGDDFDGLFRSKDKGVTWEKLLGGGSSLFKPFRDQGNYNQCLAVFPDNSSRILMGGFEVYEWEEGENWKTLSDWSGDWGDDNYVHADAHLFVFHPANPKQYYIATDGGIFVTKDEGEVFQRLNRGFNVTQFFGVGYGSDGVVLGGTQDNSNVYIDYSGNTAQSGELHNAGDGGFSAISNLLPNVFFVESQYGRIMRDNSRSNSYLEIFSHPNSKLTQEIVEYNYAWSEFVTPFTLWESNFDNLVPDSVEFTADKNYDLEDVITVNTSIPGISFKDTLKQALIEGESLKLKNPKQSMLVYGTHQALYISRNAIHFSGDVEWIELATDGCKISSSPEGVTAIAVSNDGDEIFYGTNKGLVYRVSNVSKVLDDESVSNAEVTLIGDFDQSGSSNPIVITDLAVDPNDKEHLLVTVGFYDQTTNIYKSTTASSASNQSSFVSIANNLPQIPVYSALIEMTTGNYIIGTEYGLFSSSDGGATWSQELDGPPQCPVAMIRQQTFKWAGNLGQIYVATHGRGLFTSDHYVTSNSNKLDLVKKIDLEIFPNPVTERIQFKIENRNNDDLLLQIINMNGELVYYQKQKDHYVNVTDLSSGNYILSVQKGREIFSSTFIKK